MCQVQVYNLLLLFVFLPRLRRRTKTFALLIRRGQHLLVHYPVRCSVSCPCLQVKRDVNGTRSTTSPSSFHFPVKNVHNAVSQSFPQRQVGGSGRGHFLRGRKDNNRVQRGDFSLQRPGNQSSPDAADASEDGYGLHFVLNQYRTSRMFVSMW